jgi:ribosomal protein L17
MDTDLDRSAKIAESMKGNKNATKNKLFADQLKRHLIQNPQKLEKIVEKLIDDAMEGSIAAAREVIDRVDGKAVQSTEITGADGEPLTGIQVTFVKPNE